MVQLQHDNLYYNILVWCENAEKIFTHIKMINFQNIAH